MRVPGLLYTSEKLLKGMGADEGPRQVANVAHLPGIVKSSLAMPDMHWGYGFPIGGVAAFDLDEGIVSPGGVGYDINCGCRLMTTRLRLADVRERIPALVTALFQNVPSGVGSRGPLKLSQKEERQVLVEGAAWAVRHGYGTAADLETTEDGGVMAGADPEKVSDRALLRGKDQLGTLGSGNHFLEIEVVEELFDETAAAAFGLEPGQICVLIHSGSRGLGYQVCDDYLARMVKHVGEIGIDLPDRQLACARLNSDPGPGLSRCDGLCGELCLGEPADAHAPDKRDLRKDAGDGAAGTRDEASLRRLPQHREDRDPPRGRKRSSSVRPPERGDAGLSAGPSRPFLQAYRKAGQPVLIPGDMGTGSYVLAGTEGAFTETFGSTCHGAGRVMSRTQATKSCRGRSIPQEMAERGVIVMASGRGTLMEEIPEAYKNLDDVVEVVHRAGLSRKVAKLRTLGCIKG